MKRRPFYECKIYLGSVSFTKDEVFTQDQVEIFCGEVQEHYDYTIPVRITPTTFVSETNYQEKGWEIAAIDYPKLPYNQRQIRGWMRSLAEELIVKFKQHTVCIIVKDNIIMLENTEEIISDKEKAI